MNSVDTVRTLKSFAVGPIAITAVLVVLAEQYGCYGNRKVGALMRAAGWLISAKQVKRIWRREGLKVPVF